MSGCLNVVFIRGVFFRNKIIEPPTYGCIYVCTMTKPTSAKGLGTMPFYTRHTPTGLDCSPLASMYVVKTVAEARAYIVKTLGVSPSTAVSIFQTALRRCIAADGGMLIRPHPRGFVGCGKIIDEEDFAVPLLELDLTPLVGVLPLKYAPEDPMGRGGLFDVICDVFGVNSLQEARFIWNRATSMGLCHMARGSDDVVAGAKARLTPEERRAKLSATMKDRWASRTPEQIEEIKQKTQARRTDWLASLSPHERIKRSQKRVAGLKAAKRTQTPEQKEAESQKRKGWAIKWHATRTPEAKEAIRAKIRAGMARAKAAKEGR